MIDTPNETRKDRPRPADLANADRALFLPGQDGLSREAAFEIQTQFAEALVGEDERHLFRRFVTIATALVIAVVFTIAISFSHEWRYLSAISGILTGICATLLGPLARQIFQVEGRRRVVTKYLHVILDRLETERSLGKDLSDKQAADLRALERKMETSALPPSISKLIDSISR